jgi:hypothetical protein
MSFWTLSLKNPHLQKTKTESTASGCGHSKVIASDAIEIATDVQTMVVSHDDNIVIAGETFTIIFRDKEKGPYD